MAKPRNDVPPGGEDRGIFSPELAPPGATTLDEVPAAQPAQPGRTTTRGMLPELQAIEKVYRLLEELEDNERRFVLDFVNRKFPKPPEAK